MAAGINSSVGFYSANSAFPLMNPATVPRSQIVLINPEPATILHIFLKVNIRKGGDMESNKKT